MSTSRTDSSARGLTPISSSACRATARIASVSTSTPDSLAISMDIVVPLPFRGSAPATGAAAAGGTARHGADGLRGLLLLRLVVLRVRVAALGDEPVPDDVGAGQLGEVHVV